MKTISLIFISMCFTMTLHAQVSKTANVTPGNLKTVLTADELSSVTNLTLTGTIDARDFKTMRDDMPLIALLDLSNVSIDWYKGNYGPLVNQEANYPARTIPSNAFYNSQSGLGKTSLQTIVLPLSVVMIESSAFFGCSGLMFINMPSSVTVIGKNSFQGCIGLKSVFISSSVSIIKEAAFANSNGIFTVDNRNQRFSTKDGVLFNKDKTRIIQCPGSISGTFTIPNSVHVIGFGAFSGCRNLSSVIIPESVRTIWGEAFMNCINLSEIKAKSIIPIDLTNIGNVFTGVDLVSCKLIVPFGSAELYKEAIHWKDFKNISEMPGIIIPDNRVNVVSDKGGSITAVIHSNVNWTVHSDESWLQASTTVGSGTQTLTLTVKPNTEKRQRTALVFISAEGGDSEILTITQKEAPLVVKGGDLKDLNVTYDLTGISRLKLTDTIDARDFEFIRNRMPNLSYLDLSETYIDSVTIDVALYGENIAGFYNVNEIPSGAFNNEHGVWWYNRLNTVLLPLSATEIGAKAFLNCNGLSSIIIPPNISKIGEMAFSGCRSLTSITIPSTVIYVESYAFANCTNLTSVYMKSPTVNNECPDHIYSYKDINYECTLYVPFGCSEIYNIDFYTYDFVDIVEMPGFKLSANYLNITSQSNTTNNLEILSDVTWKISSDQSWLTINPTSGSGDQTLIFIAEANSSSTLRMATVTVSADDVDSVNITVTQEGVTTDANYIAVTSMQFNCYPNPFNSVTTIKWQLAKSSKVTLKVFDIVGRTVATLVDEQRPQGKYETKFDAATLPRGIYFCQLKAGEFSQTRKMILLE